ncbi:hypothetical protein [Lapidilactobacillus wuchangensis]|uniref:hypothetical protein n=1 Tax=Lapidilactobacillus wuchangensis TaxID=2486001 RepID=UPI0013DDEC02|nr:hypothetical protein [Lapidilactobacillus wuchangensis]
MLGDFEGVERCGRRFESELVLDKVADNSVAAGGLWNVAGVDLSLLLRNNLKYKPSSNR